MNTYNYPWREKAVMAAFEAFTRAICDGSSESERIILQEFIRPVFPERKEYHNREFSWCGVFLQWVWRKAGFRPPFNLASVGRLLYSFASYSPEAQPGPHYCVALRPDGTKVAAPVQKIHRQAANAGVKDAMRRILKLEKAIDEIEPGDAIVRQRSSGSWHGHVMMALGGYGGRLTVIEGNAVSWGPCGKKPLHDGSIEMCRRDGVGIRTFDIRTITRTGSHGLWFLVKPSILDFSEGCSGNASPIILSYHNTLKAAQNSLEAAKSSLEAAKGSLEAAKGSLEAAQ